MKLKEAATLKNLVILALAIYAVVWLERINNAVGDSSEIRLEHERQDIESQKVINRLNLKVNYYENQIHNNNASVDVLNNDQLDSLFAALNP